MFSKRRVDGRVISSWKQKTGKRLEIYQAETTLHVDTAVMIRLDVAPSSKDTNKKIFVNANFHYRTYIIYDDKQPTLIYTIDTKGYLLEYRIGKHIIQPYYEDIAIGQELPDINKIVKLISSR